MLNQNTVTCFLILAQTLNFTKTAQRLGVTQQSVSKNIAKLESDLGVTLFRRNHHFVWLTSEGERFYKLFYQFSNELFKLTQLYGKNTAEGGVLRLGISEGLDLSEALRYASWNTGQELNVFVGAKAELDEALRTGDVDAVLNISETTTQREQSATVAEVPMVLLAARHLPLESEEQAAAIPLIAVSRGRESQLRKQCRASGVTVSHVISVPNQESAWTSLLLGQGVMLSNGCSGFAADPRVRVFPLERTCQLVCRWRREVEALAAFLDDMADFYQSRFKATERKLEWK